MMTRFGMWYLVTLGPAVMLFWAASIVRPADAILLKIIAVIVSLGVIPMVAVIATWLTLAFGVDTDNWLPRWYRRLFGAVAD